ncbi:hypothetical protein GCM10010123_05650 [Pilimelia anulata]|uniref:Uncharacterized protein n=1 Tax=Pilimelia anulata TaxID=53371 RepID=A0A8J3B373_9ACTN|nr:hypothetical protein [Pilimelia anulata]GGJ78561.1 hypothetical protein GCM10010123_05650 [Pilimelia anulata]
MSFAVTVLPPFGGHRWLCVEGAVDAATVGDVHDLARLAVASPGTRKLTLDLTAAHVSAELAGTLVGDIAGPARARGVEVATFGHATAPMPAPAVVPVAVPPVALALATG